MPGWDDSYAPGRPPPPWDIGQPQQPFVRLAARGLAVRFEAGDVLDLGWLGLTSAPGRSIRRA